jgi:hypothetical protein
VKGKPLGHLLGIHGKWEKMLAVVVFGCGLSILPFTACSEAPGPSDIYTEVDLITSTDMAAKEVALFLTTYNRWEELLSVELTKRSASDRGQVAKKKPFEAVMALVLLEAHVTEKRACQESGMHQGRYQLFLRRVLAVKEYEKFREMQVILKEKISKRENVDDAERKAAAEKEYRDLEGWFAPFEAGIVMARQESENNKRLYLEEIESQNKKIDEYNRDLPPSLALVKMTEHKASLEEKLNDLRFAEFHDKIKADIVEVEKVLARMEKKGQRRKKVRKNPSSSILRGFEDAVTTAVQIRDSHMRNFMKEAREAKASGQWVESAMANYAKKIEEQRQAISEIESQLKQPRLEQAARDSAVVLKVIGREKLKSISAPGVI